MPTTRLAVPDLARGLAVVAMVIYHLSWDLYWFAFVDWPVAQGPGWRAFAAMIAGSFLFLAGLSLDLAHHKAIRWHAFWRRFAVVAAAAALVSLVTSFTFGSSYVRFGILHCIAASSLIALPFLRWPLLPALAGAVFFLTLPLWASSFVFNGQLWLWTGLGTPDFGSVDYVPLAPWTGVCLAGLAASKACRRWALWDWLSALTLEGKAGRSVRFLGRHSLPVYLLHQPLLYGLVWSLSLLGPHHDRAAAAFVKNCSASCQDTLGAPDICEAACGCTLSFLEADGTWTLLTSDPANQDLRSRMNKQYKACLADPAMRPPATD